MRVSFITLLASLLLLSATAQAQEPKFTNQDTKRVPSTGKAVSKDYSKGVGTLVPELPKEPRDLPRLVPLPMPLPTLYPRALPAKVVVVYEVTIVDTEAAAETAIQKVVLSSLAGEPVELSTLTHVPYRCEASTAEGSKTCFAKEGVQLRLMSPAESTAKSKVRVSGQFNAGRIKSIKPVTDSTGATVDLVSTSVQSLELNARVPVGGEQLFKLPGYELTLKVKAIQ